MSGHSDKKYRDLNASGALPELHEGRFSRVLIFTIIGAMMSLLVWAATTPVDELTTGSGAIVTKSNPERVEHLDGGIVDTITVATGQFVHAGSQLLTFDTSSLDREMIKLLATRFALTAELGRVKFVLGGKGTIPEFTDIGELSPEELLFWAEQSFLDAQLGLIDAESRAILPAIDNFQRRRSSLRREAELVRKRLERNRQGQKSGAVALSAVELLEREYLQMQRALHEIDNDILAKKSTLDTNQLRKAEVQARRNREAALRQSELEEKIVSVGSTIEEIEARIARATVRASISGTIMELAVSNPNEVVAPGDLIAEIIPEQHQVEAEIEVSADKIGSVAVGMPARLKILSYDFTRYGEIAGQVTAISPSSYLDDAGHSVFRVIVSLPESKDAPRLANKPILPGMTVTADILTDSKKVLSYLLKPLRALGDRAFTEA